ncbi:type II secretion system protein [bacterium]|nr:type II secretion system protein [bacterium]
MINRQKAFTLAEVLITLGIIGVVAALTIPTLMAKTKKQQTTVALKKFYSTMSQAIKLSEVDNGDDSEWKVDNTQDYSGRTFFNTYLDKYIQYTKTETISANDYYVYMNDGTILDIFTGVGGCVDFYYDTNGVKNPNAWGKDKFNFLFCTSPQSETVFSSPLKHFGAYYEGYPRETALQRCKTTPNSCSGLLIMDNWEFKDDYPYNL